MRLVLGTHSDGAGIPVAQDADTGATFEDLARARGAAAAYI